MLAYAYAPNKMTFDYKMNLKKSIWKCWRIFALGF